MTLLQVVEGGADIVPHIRYDAKAGRLFRIDRADGVNSTVDITRAPDGSPPQMVMDFEHAEVGSIWFSNQGPRFAMVRFGEVPPPPPTTDFKPGVRIMVQLHPMIGGDVREIASVAKAFLAGINLLHDAYEAQKGANPGKLPVVALVNTIPITSGAGTEKSPKTTNYQPQWQIVGWVTRPSNLIYVPKTGQAFTPPASPVAPQSPQLGYSATPPSTGATQVGPPISGGVQAPMPVAQQASQWPVTAPLAPAPTPTPAASAAQANDWG